MTDRMSEKHPIRWRLFFEGQGELASGRCLEMSSHQNRKKSLEADVGGVPCTDDIPVGPSCTDDIAVSPSRSRPIHTYHAFGCRSGLTCSPVMTQVFGQSGRRREEK